jgi:urease accessory protein
MLTALAYGQMQHGRPRYEIFNMSAGTIRRTAHPELERARGRARVDIDRRNGHDALADLLQEGCARILFPARIPSDPVEAIIVNTAGGVTGGDRFDVAVTVREGARAVVTTQACEKIYRSGQGAGRMSARLKVAAGGRLAWLPQETILFEASHLDRRLEADIAPDATLLIAEAVVLGRAAMGETLRTARLRDSWRIRRGGKLVFAEETACDGAWDAALGAKAAIGGSAAYATILLAGPEAEVRLDTTRALLAFHGIDGGASVVDGLLIVRLVAGAGLALRQGLPPLLEHLLDSPLPRVWTT